MINLEEYEKRMEALNQLLQENWFRNEQRGHLQQELESRAGVSPEVWIEMHSQLDTRIKLTSSNSER